MICMLTMLQHCQRKQKEEVADEQHQEDLPDEGSHS